MRDGGLVRLSSRGTVPQFANPNLLFRLKRGMGEAAKEECGTALEENWGITHVNTIDTVPHFANPYLPIRPTRDMGAAAKEECGTVWDTRM